MNLIEEAAKTSFYYKKDLDFPDWKLIYKLDCKSTESELNDYIEDHKIEKNIPIAIISKQQIAGFGQYRRPWKSPLGGIWISALYPIFSTKFSSDIFLLSVSYHLCEILSEESIQVKFKWPNDILFGSKKLVGILPGLVTRGNRILYARVGIGMNLNNKTPLSGISLSEILNNKKLSEHYWTAKILKAIYFAIESNKDRKKIVDGSNRFLDKRYLPNGKDYLGWSIKEIDKNGNLLIYKGEKQKKLNY